MLRRLRYELSDRILRFPILQVRKVKQAEVATMIKDEIEPLGGFIGDAFIAPSFLGGQAITAMVFIMVQSLWLGLAAAAVVLVQAFLIPKLRAPILRLNRERVLAARALAGRIGEVVEGAVEVHAHDTSNLERADLSSRLGGIFDIRYEVFQRKFFVKFLNNLLAQMTPFFFYSGGGLLALYGFLDIGALVAVIAAYKDLPGPIKEIIDWDQRRLDVQIKYEQVIEQFQPARMIDPSVQDPGQDEGPPLAGEIAVSAVGLLDESDTRLIESVSFTVKAEDHVAIVGNGGSGKEYLGMILAGLVPPSSGTAKIGGRDLSTFPQAVTGRRLSYVGQDAYLFPVSVRENLIYGLKHKPLVEAAHQGDAAARRASQIAEAERAGNSPLDSEADWIDYSAAGAEDSEQLQERITAVLRAVDIEEDVYRFGLSGAIDPETRAEACAAVLEARAALPERLAADDAENLVVRFDPERYNGNATLAENLLFGTPRKPEFAASALADNAMVKQILTDTGLQERVLDMGANIARTMVEIFADLPPGHPFFDQFSFIDADDLPDFRGLVAKADKHGTKALDESERLALRRLPFDYVEARHRLAQIDPDIEAMVVAARKRIAERLAESDPDAIAFYRPDAYNATASLQDNILFGRLAYGQAKAEETVGRAVTEVLDQLGLRATVIEVGLDYEVGIGGNRLSAAQRQKIGLGRALLKRPDILIVNDALAVLDGGSQARLLRSVLERRKGCGVIWTLQRPDDAENFDRVLVMEEGRLVEQGSFADLNRPGSALSGIMAAE
jgi:putative ABC transport system ATP-binding protein